ncbi:MAG: uracil phosphoribosyltransferase [Promethearchaeota archaeon]
MIHDFSDNAIISEVIARLRNKETRPPEFREKLHKLGMFLAYEYSKDLPSIIDEIETPLAIAKYKKINCEIVVIGILRAALPMVDGVMDIFYNAHLGVVSAARKKMIQENGKDFEIETGYWKIPDTKDKYVVIVDPMLASGSTLLTLLDNLKKEESLPANISVFCAIAAKYGVDRIIEKYSDVNIFAGVIDKTLNSHGYIVPGLGDAGDRAFNT